ncbi:hypothetical protein BJX70DRAFT_398857 [Aspergillus crustosus]
MRMILYPPVNPIKVVELPLPPVAAGCIGQTTELRNGNFLPDNKYIVATVNFTSALACPDPSCIYTDVQLILLKVDGGLFPNGDPWKCITCGVSPTNRNGSTALLEYPKAFKDGERVLAGNNIIDCGAILSSPRCTPA